MALSGSAVRLPLRLIARPRGSPGFRPRLWQPAAADGGHRHFSVGKRHNMMDMSIFTEEQLTVREAIEKICTRFPNEYWQEHDQSETDPKELHAALAADGWLGIALPEEFGGAGLGISEATVMLQTISQSGAGMAGAQSIHANVYATQPLARFGNKEQLESTIPNIISGKWRVCFGVTEPNTGLDTLKLKTTATRDGDKYVITGKSILPLAAAVGALVGVQPSNCPSESCVLEDLVKVPFGDSRLFWPC